jgi:hypothetical protein
MKHRAYIHYSADIEGIKFNSLEPEIHHPLIESLILKMMDSQKICLEFIVNVDSISIEEARELTREVAYEVATRVLDAFCFFHNTKSSEIVLALQKLESTDKNGNKTIHVYRDLVRRRIISATVTRHVDKLDPRFIDLVNADKQFGFAMQVDDPVARYMLLYSLLLQTKEDRQKEVDRFICIKDKDVKTSKSPQRPKPVKSPPQDETIYTTLRNEIGHVRKGSTFKETCRQIGVKVKGLEDLTKLAIEEFQPLE